MRLVLRRGSAPQVTIQALATSQINFAIANPDNGYIERAGQQMGLR